MLDSCSFLLDIHIRSEGCDDPGMTAGTCGIAYIIVNGKDHSPHGRGHNVVIADAKTGIFRALMCMTEHAKITPFQALGLSKI